MRLKIRVGKSLLDAAMRAVEQPDPAAAIVECAKIEVGRVEAAEGDLPTVLSPTGVKHTDPKSACADYQPEDPVDVEIEADEDLLIKSMYAAMVPTFHQALVVLMRIRVYESERA